MITHTPQSNEQQSHAVPHSLPLRHALVAGVCWSVALALLLSGSVAATAAPLAPQRVLFYLLVVVAAITTFAPIERRLELPTLTWGTSSGLFLLFYVLAFVPPPTDWLFALHDMPVYVLLMVAVFLSVAYGVLPFMYIIRQRFVAKRARRFDKRIAYRHAYEIGAYAVGIVMLAAMRVVTGVSVLLLALIVLSIELLVVAQRTQQHLKHN